MKTPVLIIPGYANSGPDHWQTFWEKADPSMVRLQVDDWDAPVCASWVKAIDAQSMLSGELPVIVAHSMGCLAVARWAAQSKRAIRGALLVAVPDPDGSTFPPQAKGFSPVSLARLPFKSIVVASQDDPYGTPSFARSCADAWESAFVDIGRAGHINSASNLGSWPRGLKLLEELRSSD